MARFDLQTHGTKGRDFPQNLWCLHEIGATTRAIRAVSDTKSLFGSWMEAICSGDIISFQESEKSVRDTRRVMGCFPPVFVAILRAMFLALLSWVCVAVFVSIVFFYALYKQKVIGEEQAEPRVHFQLDTNANRITVHNATREDERVNAFDIDQILEFYSFTESRGGDTETTIFCVDRQDKRLTLVDRVAQETGGKELAKALGFICDRPASFIGRGGVTPLYEPSESKG